MSASKESPPWPMQLVSSFFELITSLSRLIWSTLGRIMRGGGRLVVAVFSNPMLRLGAIAVIVVGFAGLVYLMRDLPSPTTLTSPERYAVSTQIFDRNGILLYEIFADENRIPVTLDSLPPHVLQATIAIEDQNFYRHFGFDFAGIARALVRNLRGERLEGGSTITQQLVKNALLTRERSIQRKVKEAILAVLTEMIYTKDEILEMYLNYIAYGGTAVGIEAAANSYFNKSAHELSLAEAALLAGLPQAPSRYSPFGSDPNRAKLRQQEVLRRMVEDGYISRKEAEAANQETLEFALSRTDIRAPHFVFFVRDWLYNQYGTETVERGGLRVTTTLDWSLQQAAQASLSAEVNRLADRQVSNGAALVTKPNTGEILAMIGSKDYFDVESEGQVNVTIALRQPGSAIKPITYATALQEKVLNPGSILIDAPTCFEIPGQTLYCPRNYDRTFRGPVTVRRALGNSLNIPAVKTLRATGLETFMDQARRMGITTWDDPDQYGWSLTLGGGEVRMTDMAQSFGVLANQGVKTPLTPILKVENFLGEELMAVDVESRVDDLETLTSFPDQRRAGELERVMDRAPAYLTSHIMQDNTARIEAFGSQSQLVIPNQIVSVKTGTTNDLKDNWTVGFTPEFLTVTWVGNNDGAPMNRFLVSGITGAAPIFNQIMSFILQDREPIWQDKPLDVQSAQVCINGMPPGDDNSCRAGDTELYWTESLPSRSAVAQQETWIDPETGLPPSYGEELEGLVLETRTFYQDPVTDLYCLDCSRPVDEEGGVVHERYVVPHELRHRHELLEESWPDSPDDPESPDS